MADEVVLPIPNQLLPQHVFLLTSSSSKAPESKRADLLAGIEADNMTPYYEWLATTYPELFPIDETLKDKMTTENETELLKLNEKVEEAQKIEGQSEIGQALRAKADYLTRIGEKEKAVEAQTLALEKTPGLGARIDIVLTIARIGFFFSDHKLITENLAKAETLIESGGDWDRRNRLKVYKSIQMLRTRQFTEAAPLLLDALSTFTANEVVGYDKLVEWAIVVGVLVLERPDVKKRLLNSPETLALLPSIPAVQTLVNSLYSLHYASLFTSLAELEANILLTSRVFAPHARYYVREMRIKAYKQLLESYRSVTLERVAGTFGVTVEWVDNELARFIALGRLHARIDRVHGVVETSRPARRNAQCDAVVKQGDMLLGKVQRLSKVLY